MAEAKVFVELANKRAKQISRLQRWLILSMSFIVLQAVTILLLIGIIKE